VGGEGPDWAGRIASFLNKMMQCNQNQFRFENCFTNLSFTVMFSSYEALTQCSSSVACFLTSQLRHRQLMTC